MRKKIYDENLELNLPDEICKAMKIIGFKDESIQKFINAEEVQRCKILPADLQKAELAYYFNNLIMLTDVDTPDDIRITLTLAFKPVDWLGDLTTVVLPFIHQFEDDFYK